jgi:hypothetical protein
MQVMSSVRFVFAVLCIALALLAHGKAYAQTVSEDRLKAALIYNFIMFTEWPASISNERKTLTICVSPDTLLMESLRPLEVRTLRNSAIRILPLQAPADYAPCAVLLIEERQRGDIARIRNELNRKSVLTILIGEDTEQNGAMIAISTSNGRMAFDVNTAVAQDAQLTFSSKLLRLARKVR